MDEADYIYIVHRINTYPLIHAGFFHALFNILALTPLLERFEAEHGTLLTGSFFMGRTSNLQSSMIARNRAGTTSENTVADGR